MYTKAFPVKYVMPHVGLIPMSIETVALYPAASCCAMASRRGRRRMAVADDALRIAASGATSPGLKRARHLQIELARFTLDRGKTTGRHA